MLRERRIAIGIGGGIAAYKACELISRLVKSGAQVRAVLTESAQAFVTPLTAATLSRQQAYTDADFWQPHPRPLHIELAEWAEVLVVAPLTANTLGKLAAGLADNLLTNTVLASRCPLLLAPAMNVEMWGQPAVQRNWSLLQQAERVRGLDPGSGLLACDRVGTGRMAEPAAIELAVCSALHAGGRADLAGKRVLVTAGGTREPLDPVRFLGNPATGRMGLAIAQAAAHRGAEVTLIGTWPQEAVAAGIALVPASSAARMHQALLERFERADWAILAAAVADIKPASYWAHKRPKRSLPTSLPLAWVPDIAADLGARKQPHQTTIGFAAQTGETVVPAREKLARKQLDAIAANPIDAPDAGFGSETNRATLLDAWGRERAIGPCSKFELAHGLLDFVATLPQRSAG